MLKIYVGNLNYKTSEQDLSDMFGEFGRVDSSAIVMDRATGRSRGFAFVEMPDQEQANTAIEKLNQQEIAGRAVNVNEARPRQERGGGGGGGRRDRW